MRGIYRKPGAELYVKDAANLSHSGCYKGRSEQRMSSEFEAESFFKDAGTIDDDSKLVAEPLYVH
jgi:hypothetical protein